MQIEDFSTFMAKVISNLSSNPSFQPEGYAIQKEGKENMVVEFWASVSIVDKEGDIVDIKDLDNAMSTWMERGGDIYYKHQGKGGRKVGEAIRYEKAVWSARKYPERAKELNLDPDFETEGIKVIARIYNHYDSDKELIQKITSGDVRQVSLGGRSHLPVPLVDPKTGQGAILRRNLEIDECALVENGMNPMADFIRINDMRVLKAHREGDNILTMDEVQPLLHAIEDTGYNFQEACDIVKGTVGELDKLCGEKKEKEEKEGKEGDSYMTDNDDTQEKGKPDTEEAGSVEAVRKEDFDELVGKVDKLTEAMEKMVVYAGDGAQGGTNPTQGGEGGQSGETITVEQTNRVWSIGKEDWDALWNKIDTLTKAKDEPEKKPEEEKDEDEGAGIAKGETPRPAQDDGVSTTSTATSLTKEDKLNALLTGDIHNPMEMPQEPTPLPVSPIGEHPVAVPSIARRFYQEE